MADAHDSRDTLSGRLNDQLRQLSVALNSLVSRHARSHDHSSTDTHAMGAILAATRHGEPINPGELAATLGLSAAATSALINRLLGRGLLVAARNADDGRHRDLYPDPRMREISAYSFQPLLDAYAGIYAQRTDEQLHAFSAMLDDLISATQAAELDSSDDLPNAD